MEKQRTRDKNVLHFFLFQHSLEIIQIDFSLISPNESKVPALLASIQRKKPILDDFALLVHLCGQEPS